MKRQLIERIEPHAVSSTPGHGGFDTPGLASVQKILFPATPWALGAGGSNH
jgi:hypothetical protein